LVRYQSMAVLLILAMALVACGPVGPSLPTPPPIPVAATPAPLSLAPGEYVLDEAHKSPEKDQPCPT